MTCIVCHRSVATRAKKCSACGAPTALSKGDFLFEMNIADKNQLNRYYQQAEVKRVESTVSVEGNTNIEKNTTSHLTHDNVVSNNNNTIQSNKVVDWGILFTILGFILPYIGLGMLYCSNLFYVYGNLKLLLCGLVLFFIGEAFNIIRIFRLGELNGDYSWISLLSIIVNIVFSFVLFFCVL